MNTTIPEEMRQSHDMARLILGNNYPPSVQPFIKIVRLVMKHNNESAVEAIARIAETHLYTENQQNQMMFHAAAVDIIEHSK